jgi:hypothetical protein
MKPTSKTPYEIRLELLQLAQTILDAQHKSRAGERAASTAPTAEEVISEAEKLNAFVSKANPTH